MEAGTAPAVQLEYGGFWRRVAASLIDTFLQFIIFAPILAWAYGFDFFISGDLYQGPLDFFLSWVVPAIAVILFWMYKQATPGKMVMSLRVVDAKTGERPSTGQLIGRYFAYFVSGIGLCLGYVWVAFDPKKQGWHDKLAGTVVVTPAKNRPEPVRFGRDYVSRG